MVGLMRETEISRALKTIERIMETDAEFRNNLLSLVDQFNKNKEKDNNNNNNTSRVSFRDEVDVESDRTCIFPSPEKQSNEQQQNHSRDDLSIVDTIENTPKSKTYVTERCLSSESIRTEDWEHLVEEEERRQTPKTPPEKVSRFARKIVGTPRFVGTTKSILKTTPLMKKPTSREVRQMEPMKSRQEESLNSQANSTPVLATVPKLNESKQLPADCKTVPKILNCFVLGDDFFLRLFQNQFADKMKTTGQEDRIGYCVTGLTIREARRLIHSEGDQLTNENTIIINIGSEDILRRHQILNMIEDYTLLIESLRHRGIGFVLTTLAPIYESNINHTQKSNLAKLNKWIRKRNHIDLFKCMLKNKKISPTYFTKKNVRVNGSRHLRHLWSSQGELHVLNCINNSLLNKLIYNRESDVDCN